MSRSRKPLGKALVFLGVFVLVILPMVEVSLHGSVGLEDSSGEVSSVSRRGIQGIQSTEKSTAAAGEADGSLLRQYGTGVLVGVLFFSVVAILLWISLLRRRRRRSKSRLILDVGKYPPALVSARIKRSVLEKKSDDPPPAAA